jgi:AraC-like DNA-binding protein
MTRNLPLIRLSTINPFLLELRRRGADAESLLQDLGLPCEIPASQELFVASHTIYEFVERAANVADDPYFGFGIGSALNLPDWEPIAKAMTNAATLGELLTMWAVDASEHSMATRFHLNTVGDSTTFGAERINKPPVCPGQNDATFVGLISRFLRQATRNHWDAKKVLFRVADPACIPPNEEGCRIAQGDKSGAQITFPSRWLLQRLETSLFSNVAGKDVSGDMPRSLIDSVRSALRPHLHETDLTVDKAAKICGYNRRRLSRELRDEGTTISREIARLRAQRASDNLANTNRRVAEIAETVGFIDPTVFSRAFKNWTGKSPQEYRRTHRSP